MSEYKNKKQEKDKKRKQIISIVCLALAAVFLLWTVAGSMMFSFAQETDESLSLQSSDSESEMRGIWVCTVGNLDYPTTPSTSAESLMAQADAVINDCYDLGMNTIFLQVRPASDAFYPSEYYPWSRYLTGTQGTAPEDDFDPLAYWVQQAHAKGIELHAWINPYRITTSSSDWNRLSSDNPAKGAYNDYVVKYDGNYYFDPGSPEVRHLITASIEEIVRNYDVDGIHFDDYFYPGASFDDSATYAAYGNGQNKADWRRDNVNQLIQQVTEAVHSIDSHCVFGVSPMGVWANSSTSSLGSATRGAESYADRYADCYTWIKNNWLDYIAPQIYWNIGYSIADYQILANWWNDVVDGTDVKLYIGMADYRVGTSSWKNGVDGILDELVLNDTLSGISGEIHFRYKSVAGSSELSALYKRIYAANRMSADTDPVGSSIYDSEPVAGLYDIADHWAVEYIKTLVEEGILSGMGDATFRPDNPVTRAQFVKMLAASAGASGSELSNELTFEDVPENAWFTDSIKWACSLGIVSGRSAQEFAPDDQITREEMAVILSKYCSLQSGSGSADNTLYHYGVVSDDNQTDSSDESGIISSDGGNHSVEFPDSGDISDWAMDAVADVVERGLMNGSAALDGNVYFYPSHTATRAEAAKVIYMLKQQSAE